MHSALGSHPKANGGRRRSRRGGNPSGRATDALSAIIAALAYNPHTTTHPIRGRRSKYAARGGKAGKSTHAPPIGGKLNLKLVRIQWKEILRLAASIRHGTVTASIIMRKLASYPRQNSLHTPTHCRLKRPFSDRDPKLMCSKHPHSRQYLT